MKFNGWLFKMLCAMFDNVRILPMHWHDSSGSKMAFHQPGDLSSVPGTHAVEGKDEYLQAVLWLLSYDLVVSCVRLHIHMYKEI